MRAWRRTSVFVAVAMVAATLSPLAARATSSIPPTVIITAPTEGSTATGQLTVTAVAHIDSLDGDAGQFMALFVNGVGPTVPNVACQPVPDPSTCTATWVIDTWSLPLGTITLEVGVATLDGEGFSDPVHVLLPVHPPVAFITSPKDATTFVPTRTVPDNFRFGILHIAVQGGQNGVAAGTVASWQLLVDGAATTVTDTCGTAWTASGFCMGNLYWTASLAGPHVLVARLTVGATVVDSAPITVTVVRPTVTITSPANGAIVYGSPSVVATGAVATAGDAPVSMGLMVNGIKQYRSTPCPENPTSPGTCTLNLPLGSNLSDSTLPMTLSVFFLTTQSSAMSAPITLTRYVHRAFWWSDPDATGPAGTAHRLVGHLRNGFGPADAGVLVTVVITPARGTSSTRQVVTDAAGAFTLTVRPRSNTTVTAIVPGTPAFSAVSTPTKVAVRSTPRCALPTRLTKKAVSMVRCTVPGVPDGVKVSLQFLAHKHWYALHSAFSRHGVVALPLRWDRKGKLEVRVVVVGSRAYVTTWGKPVLLKVS